MSDAAEELVTASGDGGAVTLLREPQQERSRRTLRRILGASLELLEGQGPDGLTVTGITKRARTSVGSFYARFQGKEDLVRYLGERTLQRAASEWKDLGAGISPGWALRESAGALVAGLGSLYLEGSARVLVLLDGIEDPEPTRLRRLEGQVAEGVHAVLNVPEVRARLATKAVTGALRDSASGVPLSELVELVVGYLGGEVRPPTEGPPPAAVAPAVEEEVPTTPESGLGPEAVAESPAPTPEPAPAEWLPAARAESEPEPPSEPVRSVAPEPEAAGTVAPPAEPVLPEPEEEPVLTVPAAPLPTEPEPLAPTSEPAVASTPDPEPEVERDPESPDEPEDEPDPDPFDVWG